MKNLLRSSLVLSFLVVVVAQVAEAQSITIQPGSKIPSGSFTFTDNADPLIIALIDDGARSCSDPEGGHSNCGPQGNDGGLSCGDGSHCTPSNDGEGKQKKTDDGYPIYDCQDQDGGSKSYVLCKDNKRLAPLKAS